MTDTKSGNRDGRSRTGRPRGFDPEQGVATAMRLFWEKGYDTVGVAELSQSIGINPPSLYAAYGSKKDLFGRALAHYAATKGHFFSWLDMPDAPVFETLIAVLEEAARSGTSDAVARGCMALDGTRNCADPDARALTAVARQALRDKALALIARTRPDVADAGAGYFMFVLAAISASAVDGVPLERLMADIAFAGRGLKALLDQA